VLITAGALVHTVAVYTVLPADGAVEIISLDIDQPPN
jgi:hypothetical protein